MRELSAHDTFLISGGFLASDIGTPFGDGGGAVARGLGWLGAFDVAYTYILQPVGTAIGTTVGFLAHPPRLDGSFHCPTPDPQDRVINWPTCP